MKPRSMLGLLSALFLVAVLTTNAFGAVSITNVAISDSTVHSNARYTITITTAADYEAADTIGVIFPGKFGMTVLGSTTGSAGTVEGTITVANDSSIKITLTDTMLTGTLHTIVLDSISNPDVKNNAAGDFPLKIGASDDAYATQNLTIRDIVTQTSTAGVAPFGTLYNNQAGRYSNYQFFIKSLYPWPASSYITFEFPSGFDISAVNGKSTAITTGGLVGQWTTTGQIAKLTVTSAITNVAAGTDSVGIIPYYVLNSSTVGNHIVKVKVYNSGGTFLEGGADTVTIVAPTNIGVSANMDSVGKGRTNIYLASDSLRGMLADSTTIRFDPQKNIPDDGYVHFTFPAGWDISGLNGETTGNVVVGGDSLGGETIAVTGQTAKVPNTKLSGVIAAGPVMRTRFKQTDWRSPYAAGTYTIGISTFTDSTTPDVMIDSGTVTLVIREKTGILNNVRFSQRNENARIDSIVIGLNLNTAIAAGDTLKIAMRGGSWNPAALDVGTDNAGGDFAGSDNIHAFGDTIMVGTSTGVGPGYKTLVLPAGVINSTEDSTHQITAWVFDNAIAILDSGTFALDITDNDLVVTSGSPTANVTTNYTLSAILENPVPSGGKAIITFPYGFNTAGVNAQAATGALGGSISASDSTVTVTVSSAAATGTRTLVLPSGIQNRSAAGDSLEVSVEFRNASDYRLDVYSAYINLTAAPSGELEILKYKRSNWVASAISTADTLVVKPTITVPVNGYLEVLYPAGFSGFSNLQNQTISTGTFRGVMSVSDTTSTVAKTVRVKLSTAVTAGNDTLFLPAGIRAPSTTGTYTISARTMNASYIELERYGTVDSTIISDPTAFTLDTLRASNTQASATGVTYTLVFNTRTTLDQSSPDSIQVIFPAGFGLSGAGKGINTDLVGTSDVNPPVVRGDTMLSFEVITASVTAGQQRIEITGITNPSTSGTYTIKVRSWDRSGNTTLETNPSVASNTIAIALTGQTITATFTLDSTTTDLQGNSFRFKFKGAYSPGFTGGAGWTLWMHTDGDLTSMDSTRGGIRIAAGNTTGSGSTSLVTANITADTRLLGENVTYYLYATLPASAPYANNTVVGVSTSAFTVRHQPTIDQSTDPIEPSASTGNVTLNSGTASPTNTFNIEWVAVDYNSSTLDVKIWISTVDSLGRQHITQNGTAVTALTNATRIGTDATITKNSVAYTLNVTSPTLIAKGVYYVYVTVHDGTNYNIARSGGTLTVKHAPAITLDNPGKTGLAMDSIDASSRLVMPVYWGTSGAYDRDDAAPSISLYLSTLNTGTVATLTAHSSTITLTSTAISLNQTVENSTSNSLFTVDLNTLKNDGTLPTANTQYYVYAVITDGQTGNQILEQAATRVKFTYTPKFTFKASFGGSGAKAAKAALGDDRISLRKGDKFRINFSAYDLDQDQQIRLVACAVSGLNAADFDPSLGGAYPYGASSWLITSTDGTKGVGPGMPNLDTLLTTDSVYVWDTGNMNNIVDGNYYIYAVVSNDGSPYEFSNDSTEVFQSDGTVNLSGATGVGTPPSFTISLSPNVVAVTENEIMTFDVVVNTAGASANEISFFLNIPDSVFTVLDENNDKRPFIYTNATYLTDVTALKDTFYTNASDTSKYLDFRKFRVAGGQSASDAIIASFKVKAKGNLLIRAVDKNISFVQTGSRTTQMSEDAVTLPMLLPAPAMKVRTLPLARITGNVPLEGRTDFGTVVKMELRENGSFTPITNTLFNSSNDIDAVTAGVQVQANSSGAFELVNVPSGTYDLVAFVTNYLTGQARDIEVVPGELQAGANPVYGDDNELGGAHNYLELRGGDVSSGNQVGVADNVVDADDIQYLQDNFGAVNDPGDLGDVNGNGEVDFTDFLIAAGNVGAEGVEPTFNKEGAQDNSGATVKLVGIPERVAAGAEFEVSIMVQDVKDLKGYMFTLVYDNALVELVGDNALIDGDFLYSGDASARSSFFTIDDRKGLVLVNSLLGKPRTAVGTGEIMRVRFRAITDGPHPDISLADVQLANSVYDLTSINEVADVPTEFALMQNYPNPFNPETRIRFNIPEASRVVLKIYNILGQEVRTLVNEQVRAGYHSMIWDGTNNSGVKVASGIYIYRIKSGNFNAVKKMVMLK